MKFLIKCPKCKEVQYAVQKDQLHPVTTQTKTTNRCNKCRWVITEEDFKRVWPLNEAQAVADLILTQLVPDCVIIEIAGSIRRKKDYVGDIEILCIPKLQQTTSLFGSGSPIRSPRWISTVYNLGAITKGSPEVGKYIRIRHSSGISIDIFTAVPENWGYQLAIRTGSADFSKALAFQWKAKSFFGNNGYLWKKGLHDSTPERIDVPTEEFLFSLLGLRYPEPENRIDHTSLSNIPLVITKRFHDLSDLNRAEAIMSIHENLKSHNPKGDRADLTRVLELANPLFEISDSTFNISKEQDNPLPQLLQAYYL